MLKNLLVWTSDSYSRKVSETKTHAVFQVADKLGAVKNKLIKEIIENLFLHIY